MNYIHFPIPYIKKFSQTDSFNFLDLLKENVDIEVYYNIINNLDSYVFKNLWNNLLKEWSKSIKYMQRNKNKKYDNYLVDSYKIIHNIIYAQELNEYLDNFIKNDKFKAFFVINCILKYT
jgi:hypothetical protein